MVSLWRMWKVSWHSSEMVMFWSVDIALKKGHYSLELFMFETIFRIFSTILSPVGYTSKYFVHVPKYMYHPSQIAMTYSWMLIRCCFCFLEGFFCVLGTGWIWAVWSQISDLQSKFTFNVYCNNNNKKNWLDISCTCIYVCILCKFVQV